MLSTFWTTGAWLSKFESYNPGQNSLGSNAIFIFLSFLWSLIKKVRPFWNFLAVLPPPSLCKVETRKKILDTHVQDLFWGEGRAWICVNRKTPQKCRSVLRLLSSFVLVSLWIPLSLPLANKDVSKPSLWWGGRRDGRTGQRDKPAFDFVFKPSDIVGRGNVGY